MALGSQEQQLIPSPSDLRIAVVDDYRDAAHSLSLMLEMSGFTVVATVVDSRTAVDCVKENGANVVILDLAMPNVDGYEIARLIKSQIFPCPRLIAITGLSPVFGKRDRNGDGFDAHFMKPANPQRLEELLLSYLEDRLLVGARPS
jgi:CheY-like chemotaxis protein